MTFIHVFDGGGECFVGSLYFTFFVDNAFSLLFTMKTSISGPSDFTPISMKFLMGSLEVPRTPRTTFEVSRASPGTSLESPGMP